MKYAKKMFEGIKNFLMKDKHFAKFAKKIATKIDDLSVEPPEILPRIVEAVLTAVFPALTIALAMLPIAEPALRYNPPNPIVANPLVVLH